MLARVRNLLRKVQLTREVLKSPKVTIDSFGDEYSREIYALFTARHPRIPLIRFKSFGVMLRDLSAPTEELLTGSRFELMRRKARKAEKLGYTLRKINTADHVFEIMAINTSTEFRQGYRVTSSYTDINQVRKYNRRSGTWFGVFDKDGILRAYCHTPIPGDYFFYSTILGDANHLNDGIMYFMVRETIRLMHERFLRHGYPRWAMYDTYIGGTEGLREFKRRTGFQPMRVTWRWIGQEAVWTARQPVSQKGFRISG